MRSASSHRTVPAELLCFCRVVGLGLCRLVCSRERPVTEIGNDKSASGRECSIQTDSLGETPQTTPGLAAISKEPLGCYSGFVDKRAQPVRNSRTPSAASPTFEELAAQQGVSPIDDFESLLGEPLSEDETVEEFAALLREWPREGTRPVARQ